MKPLFAYLSASLLLAASALGQSAPAPESPIVMNIVDVSGDASAAERMRLPNATEVVVASRVATIINVVDPEDALKYVPSLFLRKRNNGDNQSTLATRVWGTSSSARSLIFADGVPISALIANNNTVGGPRWGLISPGEIDQVEVMYGPYSAEFAGNSMGAVVKFTTRQPEHRESSASQTGTWQRFRQYGTHSDYFTSETAVAYGDRLGGFSFRLSGNQQYSRSQPLAYITSATIPPGTTGAYPDVNKLGQTANVLGGGGIVLSDLFTGRARLAYDFSNKFRATYGYTVWTNNSYSHVETYLRDAAGNPTYAGQAAFAANAGDVWNRHDMHSLALTGSTGTWTYDATGSRYYVRRGQQTLPAAALPTGTAFASPGTQTVFDGTGWQTVELKARWAIPGSTNQLSFGYHEDRYQLLAPTYLLSNWHDPSTRVRIAAESDGRTRTRAVWAQDTWQAVPTVSLTLGTRLEWWRASDGYNAQGLVAIRQPALSRRDWSPKAAVTFTGLPDWSITASIGQAYRYATTAELYQLVTTGTTFTSPSPNLKPDDTLATELRAERLIENGRVRISLFQDDVHDAIIAQFNPLVSGSSQLFSYLSNVDHVRARGIEAVFEKRDFPIKQLDVTASVTYVNARTLSMSGLASATAAPGAANGKHLPNIPDWRTSTTLTYRPTTNLSVTLGARYSDKLYSTLDNTDTAPNHFGGFAAWFVADLRIAYRNPQSHWTAAIGADNLLNRKYFLFHPFPQRTITADLGLKF